MVCEGNGCNYLSQVGCGSFTQVPKLVATLPNGVSENPRFPPSSSTCTPADLKQSRAVALHEPHLSLIARIRLRQQESRKQLQILRRDITRQQIEMRGGWSLYRRFSPNIAVSSAETVVDVLLRRVSTRKCARCPARYSGALLIDSDCVGTYQKRNR